MNLVCPESNSVIHIVTISRLTPFKPVNVPLISYLSPKRLVSV